jgi:ribonuclease Z
MFGVTILGNNSALPVFDRHPTAQIVTLNDQLFLIDCGEGTQMQLSQYKIRRSKINHIFISHLHGDHYFGLPGLINSYGLMSREADLHVYAPSALRQILNLQFEAANTKLPFTLHFHSLPAEGIIVEDDKFSVTCFPVQHRIDCWGFLIKEKTKPRKIDKNKITQYNIPVTAFDKIKMGEDIITNEGETIKNELLTLPGKAPKSYAYCADTLYQENIASHFQNATMVYHETTYLKDLEDRAALRFHSTTVQAGKIAQLAKCEKLLIGHFSSKYEKLDEFLIETKEVFANTQLAIEGVTFLV